MTTNTTDHLQALRKGAAEVLERHAQDVCWCEECNQKWPCDSADLARQMTTLLDKIGWLHTWVQQYEPEEPDNEAGAVLDTIAWQLQNAIASAAQKRENKSG